MEKKLETFKYKKSPYYFLKDGKQIRIYTTAPVLGKKIVILGWKESLSELSYRDLLKRHEKGIENIKLMLNSLQLSINRVQNIITKESANMPFLNKKGDTVALNIFDAFEEYLKTIESLSVEEQIEKWLITASYIKKVGEHCSAIEKELGNALNVIKKYTGLEKFRLTAHILQLNSNQTGALLTMVTSMHYGKKTNT